MEAGQGSSGAGGSGAAVGQAVGLQDLGATVLGYDSKAEVTAKIQGAVAPLAAFGVPVEAFTYDSVIRVWLTSKQFLKLIRIMSSYPDAEVMKSIIEIGVKKDFYARPQDCNPKGLIQLCKYLRSKVGIEEVQNLQRRKRLMKKAGPAGKADVAVLVEAFNVQFQDMTSETKRDGEKYDRQLEELRRQMRRMESRRDAELADILTRHKPACWFDEPPADVVEKLCYDMYKEEGSRNRRVVLPEGYAGFSKAREMFGNAVRRSFIEEFVVAKENKELLQEYISRKLLDYEEGGMPRQASKFRNYLAILGQGPVAAVPLQPAAGGGAVGTGGETVPPSAEGGDESFETWM